jgi:hypothetical protein
MEALKKQMKTTREAALFYYDKTENMYQQTILKMREKIFNLEKILDKIGLTSLQDDESYSNLVDKELVMKIQQNGLNPEELAKLREIYNDRISMPSS